MNSLAKYNLISSSYFLLIARMRHSYIIYDALTKSLLIDNSLKKDLEIAKKRKETEKQINDLKKQIENLKI